MERGRVPEPEGCGLPMNDNNHKNDLVRLLEALKDKTDTASCD